MTAFLAETDLSAYDLAVRRHSDWIAAHQGPNGVFNSGRISCSAYMPLPVYGHVTGQTEMADLACRNLEGYVRNGQLTQPDSVSEMMPYIPAWLVMGAALTENVRLRAVMQKHLLSFQDPVSGGFFASVAGRNAGKGIVDFDSTTQACAALCLAGADAAAIKAGNFLQKWVQAQPEPAKHIFLQWDTASGLVREFDAKQAFAHVLVYDQPKAHLYKIGLLARAFAFLQGVTGEASYLELAESHYRRAADRSPDCWTNTLAHKMAWASWTLFRLTGRRDYAKDALKMADHLVTIQQADGGFAYPELWDSYSDIPLDFKLNIGTQFATWIIHAQAMAGFQGPR